MQYTGQSLVVGDHIDTDAIIPAIYLVSSDPEELGRHCMDGLDPAWKNNIRPGATLLVAGRNFGCGSSREHAPVAILGAGIQVVIAHSFARIFYRNAFNTGLIPLEVGDDFAGFREGDELEADLDAGTIFNKRSGKRIAFPPIPEGMRAILDAGGLTGFVKIRLAARAAGAA
ncbi:MAG: 3-isopropylmalate dehydratase small subunit [Desulfovibrio sp.]|jgi:3-isopropylmalate/(R)-2-methylmalate dehydratase small subunit|nr:3-isopropylmalate dehydratase small subunit [Desulfovibrio sp.]